MFFDDRLTAKEEMEAQEMDLTEHFRANLRAALEKEGAPSARSISLKSGHSESMVRKILVGESQSPRLSTVDALAKALNVTPQYLLFGEARPMLEERIVRAFRVLSDEDSLDWLEKAESALRYRAPGFSTSLNNERY